MATPLIGINGNATLAAALGGLVARTWNATVARASVDVTGFTNFGRHRIPGMFDITGSISGAADGAIAPWVWATATVAATITLQSDAGNSIAFPAVVESAALNSDVAGGSDVTLNFALAMGTTTSTATAFSFAHAGITATWTS